jgi:hypothetical protein
MTPCGHRHGPWICISRVRCFGRHYFVKAAKTAPRHTAENDAAYSTLDRLIAEAHERGYSLDALLTRTWAEGYAAGRTSVTPPGSRCTCGAGDHRPPGVHNIHCADPDASATRPIPPGQDQP